MSKEAIQAGAEFATLIVESLRRTGTPEEGKLAFYMTEIGMQLGAVAGHVGKEATIAIIDLVRVEIAALPDHE